jgi:hypothetical protein
MRRLLVDTDTAADDPVALVVVPGSDGRRPPRDDDRGRVRAQRRGRRGGLARAVPVHVVRSRKGVAPKGLGYPPCLSRRRSETDFGAFHTSTTSSE